MTSTCMFPQLSLMLLGSVGSMEYLAMYSPIGHLELYSTFFLLNRVVQYLNKAIEIHYIVLDLIQLNQPSNMFEHLNKANSNIWSVKQTYNQCVISLFIGWVPIMTFMMTLVCSCCSLASKSSTPFHAHLGCIATSKGWHTILNL